MPLDQRGFEIPIPDPATVPVGRPMLEYLADALEAYALPANFTWNFAYFHNATQNCGTVGCAMGIAKELWPERVHVASYDSATRFPALFGMDAWTYKEIFGMGYKKSESPILYCKPMNRISPQDVAHQIRQYLAKTGGNHAA